MEAKAEVVEAAVTKVVLEVWGEGPTLYVHGRTSITAGTVNNHSAEAGIHILYRRVALEALFDSADSYPQPRCHPETRIEMLDALYNWAVGGEWVLPVRWLHGPAGAGKSALMQTLCQKLQAAGHLGGAFFFKRDHATRGNAKALFATLAYQLVLNNPGLNSVISQRVERDPSVVGRSMDVQLRQLIVDPCESAFPPLVLLIDGLDECQDEGAQQEIICLIGNAVTIHRQPYSLRFLIASRPEAHIRETFEDHSFNGIVDSMNIEQSFQDIRKYLLSEFARIHRSHRTMVQIPAPWPSGEILNHLVEKSSGYFIYASTVIKFVDDKYSRPTERLSVIHSLSATQHDTPFAALDQLYIQILSLVPVRFHSTLRDILQCTIMVNLELTPAQLDRLFDLEPGDVQLILRSLHSVLKVPADSETISVHHASFLDFLRDQQRSSVFHISPENGMNVARAVIKALSDDNHWLDTPENPLAWGVTFTSYESSLSDTCMCRRLSGKHLIKCINAVSPAAELIPLIEGVNPDFLWGTKFGYEWGKEIREILIWLKKIQPVPVDLIRRWEDYDFMFFWDRTQHPLDGAFKNDDGKWTNQVLSLSPEMLRVLQIKMSGSLLVPLEDCRQVVARSPGFVRLLLKGHIMG
ncbi:putative nwd2 protein [Mycena venus]|uniref:Putative nwd2 protein n=1 Tax=Mycena venus TaxID=2733690 RepID=A0A8H6WUN6_9AGAR|nr:putative nwd2 protein [Mycena venus]